MPPNIYATCEEIIEIHAREENVELQTITQWLFHNYKKNDFLNDLENAIIKRENRFEFIFNISHFDDFPTKIEEIIYLFEITKDDFLELQNNFESWNKNRSKYQTEQFLNYFRGKLLLPMKEVEELEPKKIIYILNKMKIIPKEGVAVTKTRGTGQEEFSNAIKEHYNYKCAVCGLSITEVLEAAHIIPYSKANDEQKFDYHNGIALCANHHKMFDCNILLIKPDYSIQLNIDITKNRKHFEVIKKELPDNIKYSPSREYLEKHYK